MTHCARRSRARVGHPTVTGPVTSTCLHDRRGRVEATQTALGEALVMRRRTRVRFPPPPPPLFHHVGPGHTTGPNVFLWWRRVPHGASVRWGRVSPTGEIPIRIRCCDI